MIKKKTLGKVIFGGILGAWAAATVVICASLAFYTRQTQTITNSFSFGNVSVKLIEEEWSKLSDDAKILYPERSVTKDPGAKNTGSLPIAVFIEVRIPLATVKTVSADGKSVLPKAKQELFRFDIAPTWIEVDNYISDDEHVHVLGFLSELEPDEETPPCFEKIGLINVLEGEISDGTILDIPVKAFGIQSRGLLDDSMTFADKLPILYGFH